MESFNKKGKPSSIYAWKKLNMEEQEEQDKDKE